MRITLYGSIHTIGLDWAYIPGARTDSPLRSHGRIIHRLFFVLAFTRSDGHGHPASALMAPPFEMNPLHPSTTLVACNRS